MTRKSLIINPGDNVTDILGAKGCMIVSNCCVLCKINENSLSFKVLEPNVDLNKGLFEVSQKLKAMGWSGLIQNKSISIDWE